MKNLFRLDEPFNQIKTRCPEYLPDDIETSTKGTKLKSYLFIALPLWSFAAFLGAVAR